MSIEKSIRPYRQSDAQRIYRLRRQMARSALRLLELQGFSVEQLPSKDEYGWSVRYEPLSVERILRSDCELIAYSARLEPEIVLHRLRTDSQRS